MEENLAPDISNESRLGYISNNRAENMPRSRIVEFDLAGKTEEIGELYFGGPLRNLSTSKRHEENISIRLAEKLEEDFDMCVVNFGSGDELPYTGLACDRERRVLFTGALEEIEEKGNSQQAEARGNLIAIEKSLLSKHTQYDEILRVLQCDSPSDELCGNNTECFECIFNKELFELNVGKDRKIEKASSNWQNKVKIFCLKKLPNYLQR